MIALIGHGWTLQGHNDEYWLFLHEHAFPDYPTTPGIAGVRVLRRLDGEQAHFLTLSYWDSLEAIRAFAGDEIERAKYYPEDQHYLLEFEPEVEHYEVSDEAVGG
jgi:heme-degrading monooxygenase HmoA